MRKRFRTLTVLASTFAMVLVLGVGTAFASDKGAGTQLTCNDGGAAEGDFCASITPTGEAAAHAYAPVGSHISTTPAVGQPGFEFDDSPAAVALFNNPLCPFHEFDETP